MKAALRPEGIICSQGKNQKGEVGVVRMSPGIAEQEIPVFVHMEHCIAVTMVTGECQWSDLPLIKKMMTGCRSLFPVVRYAFTTIPTYPNGQIGMVLASLNMVRLCDCVYTVCIILSYLHNHVNRH